MDRRLVQVFAGVLLSVILCSVALADENDPDKSLGLNNGRAWAKISSSSDKVVFLMGLEDGIEEGIRIAKANVSEKERVKLIYEVTITAFNRGEVIKVLDDFYTDISNRKIPIAAAYIFVGKRLKGKLTPEKEAELITRLRKTYSK